jgi:hypothetical protein
MDRELLKSIKNALSASNVYSIREYSTSICIEIEHTCAIDVPIDNFNKEWLRFKIQNDRTFNIPLLAKSYRVNSSFVKHYEEMVRLFEPILRKMKIEDILND